MQSFEITEVKIMTKSRKIWNKNHIEEVAMRAQALGSDDGWELQCARKAVWRVMDMIGSHCIAFAVFRVAVFRGPCVWGLQCIVVAVCDGCGM